MAKEHVYRGYTITPTYFGWKIEIPNVHATYSKLAHAKAAIRDPANIRRWQQEAAVTEAHLSSFEWDESKIPKTAEAVAKAFPHELETLAHKATHYYQEGSIWGCTVLRNGAMYDDGWRCEFYPITSEDDDETPDVQEALRVSSEQDVRCVLKLEVLGAWARYVFEPGPAVPESERGFKLSFSVQNVGGSKAVRS